MATKKSANRTKAASKARGSQASNVATALDQLNRQIQRDESAISLQAQQAELDLRQRHTKSVQAIELELRKKDSEAQLGHQDALGSAKDSEDYARISLEQGHRFETDQRDRQFQTNKKMADTAQASQEEAKELQEAHRAALRALYQSHVANLQKLMSKIDAESADPNDLESMGVMASRLAGALRHVVP